MPLRWKLLAAAAGWLLLGAAMLATAQTLAEPMVRAQIDCGTLRGEGRVRVLVNGASLGVVLVTCPPPVGV